MCPWLVKKSQLSLQKGPVVPVSLQAVRAVQLLLPVQLFRAEEPASSKWLNELSLEVCTPGGQGPPGVSLKLNDYVWPKTDAKEEKKLISQMIRKVRRATRTTTRTGAVRLMPLNQEVGL